jgi:hypothetical protein
MRHSSWRIWQSIAIYAANLEQYHRNRYRVQARKHFFFEKRSKKLLIVEAPFPKTRLKEQKFFGSFFQKRTSCLPTRR